MTKNTASSSRVLFPVQGLRLTNRREECDYAFDDATLLSVTEVRGLWREKIRDESRARSSVRELEMMTGVRPPTRKIARIGEGTVLEGVVAGSGVADCFVSVIRTLDRSAPPAAQARAIASARARPTKCATCSVSSRCMDLRIRGGSGSHPLTSIEINHCRWCRVAKTG